jgi:diguanylate cyclase (GGDEF)-like protein/putative nucleotidyltransferase with HDIG domain
MEYTNKEELLQNFLYSSISTLDTEKIYDLIIDTLENILHPNGLLFTLNQRTGYVFDVIRTRGSITCEKDHSMPCPAAISLLSGRTSLVDLNSPTGRAVLETLSSRKQAWLAKQNISSFFAIRYGQAVIGFIFIAFEDHRSLTPSEIHYLENICYYGAYALRNANLYQKAYQASITDELTSLYNRKYAFECIDRCCQANEPISLLVLDIDDFKLYNELYGAEKGDRLILQYAQIILAEMEPGDTAFRYGADEFLILKHSANTEHIREFAEWLMYRMTAATPEDTVWESTLTCGISAFPFPSADASSLLHNAEQAVFYGKSEGKGKLTFYKNGMETRFCNSDVRDAYERIAPTVYALTAAIDAKDSYTFTHSMNVSKYAVILAEALDMNANDIEIVRDAGMLHDIGKISIPETILQKTDKLDEDEYAIMKTHVQNSTKMIRYLPNMDYVIPAVVGHHERYDGKGYPRGLSGNDIPYMARILTIADCFDAMTAKRPYKQPLSISYAINELQKNSGTQFDPTLVPVFVNLIYEGKIYV